MEPCLRGVGGHRKKSPYIFVLAHISVTESCDDGHVRGRRRTHFRARELRGECGGVGICVADARESAVSEWLGSVRGAAFRRVVGIIPSRPAVSRHRQQVCARVEACREAGRSAGRPW